MNRQETHARRAAVRRLAALLCAQLAFAASAVFADEVKFPAAGGSWDISSAAAWGGTLPGTTDTVVFTGLTQTVTANADVEFGLLRNNLRAGFADTLIFDLRNKQPVPTLKFDGFQAGTTGSYNNYTTLRGGIFDFNGKSFGQGNAYYGPGRTFTFSDGVFVTNVNHMILGYTNQERLRVELSGGSKVFVGGSFKFTNNKTSKGNENWLKVTGGSLFRVAGQFQTESYVASWENSIKNQPDGNLFYKDMIEVSGEGSQLVICNPTPGSVGYQYPFGLQGGTKTVISSNATMQVQSQVIAWYSYTRNNLIRVCDGGQLSLSGAFYGGWTNGDGGGDRLNRIEVLSGGTMTVGSYLYLGYYGAEPGGNPGNTLLVSNGTLRCGSGFIPGYCEGTASSSAAVGASNQLVVIQGPEAVFDPGPNFGMFRAPFCEFRVELGAKFNPMPSRSFGRYISGRHDETVRASRGGVFEFVDFSISTENEGSAEVATAWNNRLIAESGGIVSGRVLKVQGRACSLRVDDGIVVLTNAAASALVVGASSTTGGLGTNCVLEVAGTNPKIRLGGNLSVNKDSEILFELPAAGYAAGAKPIVAEGTVSVDGTSRISFAGAEEMFAHHQAAELRADYVLIDNPAEKAFLSDAVVSAAQAGLGGDFKLFKTVKDGRNQLVLRVKGVKMGSVIIVQ